MGSLLRSKWVRFTACLCVKVNRALSSINSHIRTTVAGVSIEHINWCSCQLSHVHLMWNPVLIRNHDIRVKGDNSFLYHSAEPLLVFLRLNRWQLCAVSFQDLHFQKPFRLLVYIPRLQIINNTDVVRVEQVRRLELVPVHPSCIHHVVGCATLMVQIWDRFAFSVLRESVLSAVVLNLFYSK